MDSFVTFSQKEEEYILHRSSQGENPFATFWNGCGTSEAFEDLIQNFYIELEIPDITAQEKLSPYDDEFYFKMIVKGIKTLNSDVEESILKEEIHNKKSSI